MRDSIAPGPFLGSARGQGSLGERKISPPEFQALRRRSELGGGRQIRAPMTRRAFVRETGRGLVPLLLGVLGPVLPWACSFLGPDGPASVALENS